MNIIPEENNAILNGKIDGGKNEWKSLNDIWIGKDAYKTGLFEKWTTYLVSGPKKQKQKTPI